MTPYAPNTHARPHPSEVAVIRSVPRVDDTWMRPIFKAPPLNVQPSRELLAYSGTTQRTEPWASWPRRSMFAR
jgi:hypothetical protein